MICAVDGAAASVRAKRGIEHWAVLAMCAIAPIGLIVMGLVLVPSASGHGTHQQLGLPPCRMIEWFGVPCPGCGVTTSVTLAAQGHFVKAFLNQPFGFAMFVLGVAALPWALWVLARGRDAYAELRSYSTRAAWIAALAVVVFGWAWKIVLTLSA